MDSNDFLLYLKFLKAERLVCNDLDGKIVVNFPLIVPDMVEILLSKPALHVSISGDPMSEIVKGMQFEYKF